MSTTNNHQWKYLDRKPGSVYRQLFVRGRNIRARTLYGAYFDEENPRTMEQIAVDFDVPLDAVQEAISYCELDPPEFREDWEREEANIRARSDVTKWLRTSR